MALRPAPIDTGIVFCRSDLPGNPAIPAHALNVRETTMATVLEKDGARVFVDSRSFLYLAGSELDYFQSLMQSAFRLHNPNKKTECGCGESFSV